MILLPRGYPVKEKIDPGKTNLPEAMTRLQGGSFTGYLRFATSSGPGIIIFHQGRLISALFEEEGRYLTSIEAIGRIFERSLSNARLDIYRLSPDLAMLVHAILRGQLRYTGNLKQVNIKALLARLKKDSLSGCLRIHADDRIALIFFREGTPIGFFHDGSGDLETTADTSMSVATLPGAEIDVLTTEPEDEQAAEDLMESVDLTALWRKSR